MNYTNSVSMCRVDFWKPSGKWYLTEAIDFIGLYDEPLIHDALKKALERAGIDINYFSGFIITCLEPYHEHSHPISLKL